jgi:hypothetical protein
VNIPDGIYDLIGGPSDGYRIGIQNWKSDDFRVVSNAYGFAYVYAWNPKTVVKPNEDCTEVLSSKVIDQRKLFFMGLIAINSYTNLVQLP